MFQWNDKKTELYTRAAEYTNFNEKLGTIIRENIGDNRTIWDLGSGVSFLSLYLSKYSKEIKCVDTSEIALNKLNKLIIEKNIKNIETINKDFEEFLKDNDKGDLILASHFLNNLGEYIELLLEKSKTIVIIKNSDERVDRSLFPGRKQKIEDIENLLKDKYSYIKYKKILYKEDFGQPLKSIEEAQEYYNLYSEKSISEKEILKKIIKVNNEEYPYYYPKEKVTGMIIIENI